MTPQRLLRSQAIVRQKYKQKPKNLPMEEILRYPMSQGQKFRNHKENESRNANMDLQMSTETYHLNPTEQREVTQSTITPQSFNRLTYRGDDMNVGSEMIFADNYESNFEEIMPMPTGQTQISGTPTHIRSPYSNKPKNVPEESLVKTQLQSLI